MRIGVISDIHVDSYQMWDKIPKLIVETTINEKADVLVVCGDIATDLRLFDSFFQYLATALQKVGIQILFVPGNHDIWVYTPKSPSPTSKEKYYKFIPRVLKKHDNVHYLPEAPFIKDGHAFVGSMGWYDFSFLDFQQDRSSIMKSLDKRLDKLWADKKYMWWGDQQVSSFEDNVRILDIMLEELRSQLMRVKNVRDITVCLHMVPYHEFCLGEKEFDIFAAYMGSDKLFDLIKKFKNAKRILFGHTHSPWDEVREGVRFINASVGLWYQNKGRNIEDYLVERMKFIDI